MFKFLTSVLLGLTVFCSGAYSAPVKKTTNTAAAKKTTNNKKTNNSNTKKPNGARAASTQKVVNAGTKIAAATTNTLVDDECHDVYFGCMDVFCMVDNVSGGRCQCNNKHADLMKQLNEIMAIDKEASTIATYGADFIGYGKAAEDVLATSEAVFEKVKKDTADESGKNDIDADSNKSVNFDDWNKQFETEEDEEEFVSSGDDISDKSGDALYVASMDMCWPKVPDKCKAKEDMIKMLYANKIKGDCAAFENSLKQQKTASNQKLEEAKSSVRTAALQDFKDSNKYDLGQCVIEFTTCMQTNAECGTDFKGCVGTMAARDKLYAGDVATVAIEGPNASIFIAQSTMDILDAKKHICERVTDNCLNVKDQVWGMFLRNVAADIKLAELDAESDVRTSCLDNISNCFVKACKDNIDGADSYDMCLTRPESVKNFCKIEMEPCLAATGGSYDNPDASSLWTSILARLASMRADSCTTEFRQCLQSDDRCGSDYSQCIGLRISQVIALCPEDKLTACYAEYNNQKETVKETLEKVAKGVLLNVDNAMLTVCQKVVDEAMIKICGDTGICDSFAMDKDAGGRTLELKFCEKGEDDLGEEAWVNCKQDASLVTDVELTARDANIQQTKYERKNLYGVIFGELDWEHIVINKDSSGITGSEEYFENSKKTHPVTPEYKQKISTELGVLEASIKNTITTIESEPRVQYCMTGRQVEGFTDDEGFTQMMEKENNVHFPNLTQSYRNIIIESVLRLAKQNYYKKFDELQQKRLEEETKLNERVSEIEGKNRKDK